MVQVIKVEKQIDGLSLTIPETIYDPAEDSFLLAEKAVILPNEKVLEIGCGSGYVSLYLSKKQPLAEFFCADINYYAAKTSLINAAKNRINLSVINCDLFSAMQPKRSPDLFDIILFNAPYLPVTEEGSLESAWAGGKDGLEIITRFLKSLSLYLKASGKGYLITSSYTNQEKLETVIKKANLSFKKIAYLTIESETIYLHSLIID
jgi:release factor glutamine methyltransferase